MNIEKLLDAVEILRCVADSIEKICKEVHESTEAKAVKAEMPVVSLETVRGVLADKSQKGFSTQVKAIIRKYGAERLSDVSPEHFPDMLKEAEAIGNA